MACSLARLRGLTVTDLVPPTPNITIPKNPADRLSWYSIAWAAWVTAFAILEAHAIWQDTRTNDRVKRTLSANVRTIFATDSSGLPVDVPYGKLRRTILVMATAWAVEHLKRTKFV
jgi:hypothetical protein